MQKIDDKKDAEWKKLRKQKTAYEKRLRDRTLRQTVKEQIALVEAIISHLSSNALENVT